MTTTTIINTVADAITAYGNEWLVVTMKYSNDSFSLEYAVRSHKFGSELSSAIRYFDASLTCKVYEWLNSATALESARALTKDSETYLIDLQGDKLLKRAFIGWRDGLRQGKSFNSKVRESR